MRFVNQKKESALKKILMESHDYWSIKAQDKRGALIVAENRGWEAVEGTGRDVGENEHTKRAYLGI